MKTAEDLIEETAERWRTCEGLPECLLLRLSLLRQLLHHLHAEKSHLLAFGKRDEATKLRSWATKIEELRERVSLEGELIDVIQKPSAEPKKKRMLPHALSTFIEKEKLERYDRQWEHTMAAVGSSLGWKFFALDAWVEISQIEAWDASFKDHLWPHGLVLFTEAIEAAPSQLAEGLWHGKWICLIHPTFKHPEDIGIDFSRIPGSRRDSPSAPAWRLLFSPGRH